MKLKLIGSGLAAVTLLFAASGGGGTPASTSNAPAAPAAPSVPKESFVGQYSGSGGGGAIAVVQALIDGFGKEHPEMSWLLQDVGSDAGIQLAASNKVDLAFISRDLKGDEPTKVQQFPIGAVATAVVVNSANPVKDLTKEQVRQIFAGEVTDWAQVGGKPGRIRVLLREKVAATRTNFEAYFFGGKPNYSPDAIEVFEIDEMLNGIQAFSGAIGMSSVTNQTMNVPSIRLIGIDGVPITKETVLSGAYKVRRPLYLVYNNDLASLKPGVRALLEYVKSAEGQKILLQAGF
jgi:phosphate transport system substrate-binding protein